VGVKTIFLLFFLILFSQQVFAEQVLVLHYIVGEDYVSLESASVSEGSPWFPTGQGDGDYSVVLLDADGIELFREYFPVGFFVYSGPILEETRLMLRVPFNDEAVKVEFEFFGEVLDRFELAGVEERSFETQEFKEITSDVSVDASTIPAFDILSVAARAVSENPWHLALALAVVAVLAVFFYSFKTSKGRMQG